MSVQMVSRVLDVQAPCKAKFALVCLADMSDDFGVCWPSIRLVSEMTCMPERTVQRMMRYLEGAGLIQTFWEYTDRIRSRKVLHYRLTLGQAPRVIRPNYSNCPKELRVLVIAKFRSVCTYCGEPGDEEKGPDGSPWHVDRIIPGSKGGGYTADNVTLSCRPCNSHKRANLAPQDTVSLGAKLDEDGCQSGVDVVPQVAHDPSLNHQEPKEKPENLESQNRKPTGIECRGCGEVGPHRCPGPSAARARALAKRQRADERAIRKADRQRVAVESARPRYVERSPPPWQRKAPEPVDDSLDPDYPRLRPGP